MRRSIVRWQFLIFALLSSISCTRNPLAFPDRAPSVGSSTTPSDASVGPVEPATTFRNVSKKFIFKGYPKTDVLVSLAHSRTMAESGYVMKMLSQLEKSLMSLLHRADQPQIIISTAENGACGSKIGEGGCGACVWSSSSGFNDNQIQQCRTFFVDRTGSANKSPLRVLNTGLFSGNQPGPLLRIARADARLLLLTISDADDLYYMTTHQESAASVFSSLKQKLIPRPLMIYAMGSPIDNPCEIFRTYKLHYLTDLAARAAGGRMARLCDGDIEPLMHEGIAKLRAIPIVYTLDESEKIASTGVRVRTRHGPVSCAQISGIAPYFKIEFQENCQLQENEEFFVEYEVEQKAKL